MISSILRPLFRIRGWQRSEFSHCLLFRARCHILERDRDRLWSVCRFSAGVFALYCPQRARERYVDSLRLRNDPGCPTRSNMKTSPVPFSTVRRAASGFRVPCWRWCPQPFSQSASELVHLLRSCSTPLHPEQRLLWPLSASALSLPMPAGVFFQFPARLFSTIRLQLLPLIRMLPGTLFGTLHRFS